jgi:hypothetical protein
MESMENRVERDSRKPTEESSTDIGSYGGGGASGSVAWLGAKVREKELEQPPCIGFRLFLETFKLRKNIRKIRKSKKGSGIPEFAGVVERSRRGLFKR